MRAWRYISIHGVSYLGYYRPYVATHCYSFGKIHFFKLIVHATNLQYQLVCFYITLLQLSYYKISISGRNRIKGAMQIGLYTYIHISQLCVHVVDLIPVIRLTDPCTTLDETIGLRTILNSQNNTCISLIHAACKFINIYLCIGLHRTHARCELTSDCHFYKFYGEKAELF